VKKQPMRMERRADMAQNSKEGLPNRSGHGAPSNASAVDTNIARLIEGEIIPRLLMAHRRGPATPFKAVSAQSDVIREQDVAYIAELALDHDADMLFRHMTQLEMRGISTDQILIDCIAPAAVLLGERWEDDRIDFIDVTMAVWRLQESVHILSSQRPGRAVDTSQCHRALFSVMPGDQHNLGTQIVDECFRQAGWDTICLMATTEADLLTTVRQSPLDLVGLTVSTDAHIGDLTALIPAIRAASSNPRLGIMLGGRLFNGNTALAVRLGADGAAKDAKAAVEMANGLLNSIAVQSDAAF
jgi:MerR family transcriptional regulator, light-induced transcriptional regulator